MNSVDTVRDCLRRLKPGIDLDSITDDTPLLEQRIINSFDMVELILYLEQASGRAITRSQMVPGSFRDIRTIADVFFADEATVS